MADEIDIFFKSSNLQKFENQNLQKFEDFDFLFWAKQQIR